MCELAAQEAEWIHVDRWESSQEHFVDFPSVAEVLREDVGQHEGTQGLNLRVFYMCGADHAYHCGLHQRGLGRVGLVVVGRHGQPNQLLQQIAVPPGVPIRPDGAHEFVFCTAQAMQPVSSTIIRKNIKEGLPVDHLTFPQVVQYLESNGLLVPGPKRPA